MQCGSIRTILGIHIVGGWCLFFVSDAATSKLSVMLPALLMHCNVAMDINCHKTMKKQKSPSHNTTCQLIRDETIIVITVSTSLSNGVYYKSPATNSTFMKIIMFRFYLNCFREVLYFVVLKHSLPANLQLSLVELLWPYF